MENEESSSAIHKPDKDNWSSFRARMLIELSSVDSKFPNNFAFIKLSKNIISLGSKLIQDNEYSMGNDLTLELQKVVDLHKDRIRVETSELPQINGFDSYLKVIESIAMQLSQIQSLDLQIKVKSKIYNFSTSIKICQLHLLRCAVFL